MRIILILGAFFIWSIGSAQSQTTKDFVYYNNQTYALFQSEQWQELIVVATEALDAEFDFFYLRLRLGIAYYQRERYGAAVTQFYAAQQWNKNDPLSREYLYYSLVFSGRMAEARILEQEVKKGQTSYYGAAGQVVYKWSDQRTAVDALEAYQLGFRHPLGRHVSITHALEHLVQHFTERTLEERPSPGNGPPRIFVRENRYRISQNSYRLQGNIQWKKGVGTGLTFQQLWGANFNEQAYWLFWRKAAPRISAKIGAGYSNFNAGEQWQWALDVTFFPAANTHYYYQAGLTIKNAGSDPQRWIRQRAGVRLGPSIWLEGIADFGKINYFQESDGLIVYNIGDHLRSRLGGNIQFWLNRNNLIFLQYQLENKTFLANSTDYQHQGLVFGMNLNI